MKKIAFMWTLVLVVFLMGCAKTPSTPETFMETMEKAGYKITITEPHDAKIIENAVIANKDDYQVEFYVLTSEENAAGSFATLKNKLEPLEGGSVNTSVTASNYSSYTLTTATRYYVASRIGHTLIYLNVPKDQKKEIAALIKSLGY